MFAFINLVLNSLLNKFSLHENFLTLYWLNIQLLENLNYASLNKFLKPLTIKYQVSKVVKFNELSNKMFKKQKMPIKNIMRY